MEHGNDGNTDVDVGVVHSNLDAAILGDPFLGNVEMAKNFDARNNRGLKSFDLRWDGNVL